MKKKKFCLFYGNKRNQLHNQHQAVFFHHRLGIDTNLPTGQTLISMQLYTKQTSYVKLVKMLSPLSSKKLSCVKIHSSQRHFIKQFIAFKLDQLGTLKKYLQQFLNKTKPTHAYQQIQTHIEKSKRNPHNSNTNKNRNTDKPRTNLDRLRETNLNTMVVAALTLLSQLEAVKTRVLWKDFPNSTVSEGFEINRFGT